MKLLAKKSGRRDGIGKRALLRPDNLRIADIDAGGMPLPNMANRQHLDRSAKIIFGTKRNIDKDLPILAQAKTDLQNMHVDTAWMLDMIGQLLAALGKSRIFFARGGLLGSGFLRRLLRFNLLLGCRNLRLRTRLRNPLRRTVGRCVLGE